MKNKALFALLVLVVAAVFSSCASQKQGCPMNNGGVSTSKPFRA